MVQENLPYQALKKTDLLVGKAGSILRSAHTVCFTTEEERLLAQKTFFPYQAREVVTGLGVMEPPVQIDEQVEKLPSKIFLN